MLRALAAVSLFAALAGCRHASPVLDLMSPDALTVFRFAGALSGELERHEELPPSLRAPETRDQVNQAAMNQYADAAGFQRPYPGPDLGNFFKAQPIRVEHIGMIVSAMQTAIQVAELVGPLLKIYRDLLLLLPQMLLLGLK